MTTARPPTLTGRTAIVTGASSGIGRATAAALVERGTRVAALARELGRACVPLAIDLSDVGAIDALPEQLPDGLAAPDLQRVLFVAHAPRDGRVRIIRAEGYAQGAETL